MWLALLRPVAGRLDYPGSSRGLLHDKGIVPASELSDSLKPVDVLTGSLNACAPGRARSFSGPTRVPSGTGRRSAECLAGGKRCPEGASVAPG